MINLITCLDFKTAKIISGLFSKQYNVDSDIINESSQYQRRFLIRGDICDKGFNVKECVDFCMSKLSYAQTVASVNSILKNE